MQLLCELILIVFTYYMVTSKKSLPKVVKVIRKASEDAALTLVLEKAKSLPLTRGGWNVHTGLSHLISSDAKFIDIVARHGIPAIYDAAVPKAEADAIAYIPVPSETSSFHSLLKTIIYQQLSGKSAEPIFKRLCATLGAAEGEIVEPQQILDAKIDVIFVDGKKKITVNGDISGLSESKSRYMVDLARHFSDDSLLRGVDLAALSDEELFDKLVAVKGLGPWSVHMHMMFNLQRANVLAPGDLGIRRGLSVLHGHGPTHFESKARQSEIPELCAGWAPYSTLGCWYMWRLSEEQQGKTGAVSPTATEEGEEVASAPKKARKSKK